MRKSTTVLDGSSGWVEVKTLAETGSSERSLRGGSVEASPTTDHRRPRTVLQAGCNLLFELSPEFESLQRIVDRVRMNVKSVYRRSLCPELS